MKKVTIVGMGLGMDTLTQEAQKAIEQTDLLLGAPRVLELYKGAVKQSSPVYLPNAVATAVAESSAHKFTILVSGDVGFYSAATKLAEALSGYELSFIPGISSVSAFFARLKLPWQDAAFVSTHGREMNVADAVRRNRFTFCLIGNNVNEIAATMNKAGFGYIQTYVGENLGTEQERVFETVAENLMNCELSSLTVLLFVNEAFDDTIKCGLPDSRFARLAGIPMTKSETRALVLSKLMLRPTDICWDVGAGTGSVTVEMALSAYRGHVYAVERRKDAIDLIYKNCAEFHLGNVTAVCGEAPSALETLPVPDAVFIGGSGGEIDGILAAVLDKNPDARVAVTAVTIETVSAAMSALAKAGMKPDIVQMSIARAKAVGKLHMMEAQNPVTILSVGGEI